MPVSCLPNGLLRLRSLELLRGRAQVVARFDTKFIALYQSVTQSEKKAHGNDIDSRNFIINDLAKVSAPAA